MQKLHVPWNYTAFQFLAALQQIQRVKSSIFLVRFEILCYWKIYDPEMHHPLCEASVSNNINNNIKSYQQMKLNCQRCINKCQQYWTFTSPSNSIQGQFEHLAESVKKKTQNMTTRIHRIIILYQLNPINIMKLELIQNLLNEKMAFVSSQYKRGL